MRGRCPCKHAEARGEAFDGARAEPSVRVRPACAARTVAGRQGRDACYGMVHGGFLACDACRLRALCPMPAASMGWPRWEARAAIILMRCGIAGVCDGERIPVARNIGSHLRCRRRRPWRNAAPALHGRIGVP
ncbi:hypothetical protein K788_0002459 [Paraburkholderia caribensis MBA4]|uniref:Uncharacterized protein n=1 Tax=Paraburkholderia caribensis MBA4 TaxID=1323664 RepID=A0A0P0R9Y9_9BURK|nr:hypothetical protein K788_0002459 [Paraburkholderia caribensis MBA4]